jgi:uncharacterized membrane protein YbjE (DUF340 family)
MAIALLNILPILAALIFGLKFTALKFNYIINRINTISNLCLYALLIFMGVTIGNIPNFFGMLIDVGLMAGLIATTTSIFTAITIFTAFYVLRKRNSNEVNTSDNSTSKFDVWGYLKDPIQLFLFVGIGFITSYLNLLPKLNYDHFVNILLYLLIFSIGVKLSLSNIRLIDIISNKSAIFLAVTTIVGTYLGALTLMAFVDLPKKDILAISSGFGWYTISGLLSTKLGTPIVGSIAFLTDLFREVIALLVLPALAKSGYGRVAVGICGATAMDVTLPIVEKYCDREIVTAAFISGGVITLIVPFLIPFCFSLNFG